MRVVLDTNVLVSAFLWQGLPEEIFKLAEKGEIAICVNKEILEEFERVLSYPKFKARLSQIRKTPSQIINEFLAVVAHYPSHRFLTPQVPADQSDEIFLSCALAARASFIISGDKHLLRLKSFHGIPIVTSRQFLFRIKRTKAR